MGGGLGLVCVADIVVATKSFCIQVARNIFGHSSSTNRSFFNEKTRHAQEQKNSLWPVARLSGEEAAKEGLIDICCEDKEAMDEEKVPRCVVRLSDVLLLHEIPKAHFGNWSARLGNGLGFGPKCLLMQQGARKVEGLWPFYKDVLPNGLKIFKTQRFCTTTVERKYIE